MTIGEQLAAISDEGLAELIEEYDHKKPERMILLIVQQQGGEICEIETDLPSLARALQSCRVLVQCEKMRREGLLEIDSWPGSYLSADGLKTRITEKGEARFHQLKAQENG